MNELETEKTGNKNAMFAVIFAIEAAFLQLSETLGRTPANGVQAIMCRNPDCDGSSGVAAHAPGDLGQSLPRLRVSAP